jgi:Xaa-Pro dipeptidase
MKSLPFARAEYDRRLGLVRKEISGRGLDMLIVTDVANQNYLTGYDGWSFYTPQIVLVPADASLEPIWLGRRMDAAGGRLTAWMHDDNIVGYPDTYVQQPHVHPMSWIAEWIEARGWGGCRFGVETDTYYYSPRAHAALLAGLPNASFVAADLLVNWVRSVKSPAEIDCLRKAARLAEGAMQAACDAIQPGVRECDAIARIQAAQFAGQKDFSGDLTAIPPIILGGVNASAPHIMWSDRRFGPDETVALELGGTHRRYAATLARTLRLGAPDAQVTRIADMLDEGMNAVLEQMRPGVAAETVEAAWRKVIARHGMHKESRIGYSIGVGYPPDWGEHTISLRAGDRTELRPGHVIHAILGMWLEGWGVVLSETVHLTPAGAETLTVFPRRLVTKQ